MCSQSGARWYPVTLIPGVTYSFLLVNNFNSSILTGQTDRTAVMVGVGRLCM